MREKGETYLPKEEGEGHTGYQVRLKRSLLFNTFVKVREGLIGIALKKNPELEPDVPPLLRTHIEDIDLCGCHLDVFIKDVFRNVINDGHGFIFVDMARPTSLAPATLAGNTRADSNLRRPNWVSYKKDQALNWRSARIGGAIVLTQITFEECSTEADGRYGEKTVRRYRVLRLPEISPALPGREAVYGTMEWEIHEEKTIDGVTTVVPTGERGTTSLSRIPVVTIYSRRTGFLESEPPLIDLAYLNVGHWQQWSDLNCQLRMLVPILEVKGELMETEGGEQGAQKPRLRLGPGAVAQFRDDKGGIEYVSHDGTAIEATRQSLIDLENRMSAVGLSVISAKSEKSTQAPTATEKVLDQNERESELSSWLRALKDGVEAAMKIHAVDYLGLPTGGSIVLGFDEVDEEAVMAVNAPKGGPGMSPEEVSEIAQ